VNNIVKNNSDINDEIKKNILAEMDKYAPAKNEGKSTSAISPNQEVLQAVV